MASALACSEWGKLEVMKNGIKSDEIVLDKKEFIIGRKQTCDYFITDNPYLSGVHARLNFEKEANSVQLTDISANGILLNTVRIEKNKSVEIRDGDKITLVLKGASHALNLQLKISLNSAKSLTENTLIPKEKPSTLDVEGESNPAMEVVDISMEKPTHCDDDTTLSAIDTTKKAEIISSKQVEVLKKAGYKETPVLSKSESFEEQLLCGVCQEIMHMAVSLQPCLHSYCAGCYSDWMEISRDCPACRSVVDRIAKNHLINNLIETYLKANPDKRRSPENLAELDKKNKISEDMLYPPKKRLHTYLEDDEYYSPSDEEYPPSATFFTTFSDTPACTAFSTSLFPMPGLFTKCRQCPGFISHDYLGISPAITPTTHKCSITVPTHLICMCCCQPMPDRSTCTDLSVPPQHCDVCKNAFCNMYWGCLGLTCKGCLNEFRNFTFDPVVMNNIINNNFFESEILNQYLAKKKIGVKEMLQICLERLDKSEYKCTDSRSTLISGKTRICYTCALKNFKDLAYLYRKDIPIEDLPKEIASRPECYYGRACKTQYHKPLHARHYNHICEQTRLS